MKNEILKAALKIYEKTRKISHTYLMRQYKISEKLAREICDECWAHQARKFQKIRNWLDENLYYINPN
jgi:hypothetical protein